MDSERFDCIVRGLVDGSTRRTALRAGATTLAASVVAALGVALAAPDADAGKGKKKKKKKKKKPPPPGCSGDENYCLDDALCGPRASDCECAAGTEGTICAAPSGGLCFENSDLCETDADCDEFTGPGSVCSAVIGTCSCGDTFNTGFNACIPPCGANRAAPRRLAAASPRREAASGGK